MLRFALCVLAICVVGCGNDKGYGLVGETEPDAGIVEPLPAGRGGLPCDVQALLAERCQGCHATTPVNGAPMSLMTYRDLTAKNRDGVMIGQRAVSRMKNADAQMPPLPSPAVTAAQIATFEAWVNAGAPQSDCMPMPGPFDGPTVCTSGRMWRGGDDGSPNMHPGRACITCHTNSDEDDAPRLAIGGTVYPTGHEPNDCLGATNAIVEVTDANGAITMLPVNSSGNFLTTRSIPAPFHVAVLFNGKRRMMNASPPRGDCNSCHTPDGANGAPGRITLP